MSANFLNKFILFVFLNGILLVNLVYSYWRTKEKYWISERVNKNRKTFWNWKKKQIELICCTASLRWRWINVQILTPGQCCVPCRAVLSPAWSESVTVISFLECSYPSSPLDKQVNNILGLSSAFYKECNSGGMGENIQSFPPQPQVSLAGTPVS